MILAEAGVDSINVYLHGPMENKMQRLDEISIDGKPVTEKSMEEHDRKRRTFFKKYTGKEMSDASNYTFCFDVGKIDIPQCAEIILATLNRP